jgi:hypothetical protein
LLLNIGCASTPTASPIAAPSFVPTNTTVATQSALPLPTVTNIATATNTMPPPTQTSTPQPTPTLTASATVPPTARATVAILPTPIPQSPPPPNQSNNPPSRCGYIPGTIQIGFGFFNLQERTVTFCNADLAAIDACDPRTLEYCHCNRTSGCCENPKDNLIVGPQTTTLHYPTGTTSFQASIPPACRRHGSDRVIIMGFTNPLP